MGEKIIITNANGSIQISDGYHTFDELYEHRITLFIALCKKIQKPLYCGDMRRYSDERIVWCSIKHSDGTKYDEWFILGINKGKGKQITYHLPIKYWDEVCKFADKLKKAPDFDGHTPEDVLERLKSL